MKKYKLRIKGPAGYIETVVEEPAGEFEDKPRGLALIAHPHPLKGGSLDNKVAWTLARAALHCGLVAVRPNFRGVGDSDGAFDHGIGETEDLLALAAAIEAHYGRLPSQEGRRIRKAAEPPTTPLPWTLLGFSFGAYVQHRVARQLHAERLVMVGPAVSMYRFEPEPAAAFADMATTILHGGDDEVIPFAEARAYAEAHAIPLIEFAGAGHFFHGRLRELQTRVEALCRP